MNKNYYYKKAKKLILGGNMLLSKRPEMFLPEFWPSYFKKSNKIYVTSLDNKKYIDMICAVGTNVLGYANPNIDKKVIEGIKKGNMTTLNCPEEVQLAEELIKIHKWADTCKFCRSGGEANSIAIRIARSLNKKNNVAICGYHGWHDWYLAASLKDKELDNHLIPKLKPIGVPSVLKNTTFPFDYNNFPQLEKIVKKKKIGIIKMEVARNNQPNIKFLKEVRKLCDKNKIILIFDECTSGFRSNLGGMHLKTGVNPDILLLGKALGNGYAINAILGKKNIMSNASESFISSTFWTERVGFVAALATLKEMKRVKPWRHLCSMSVYIKEKWNEIAKNNNLKINTSGIDAIVSFKFEGQNNLIYKTYITQEMLKRGYLASNLIYLNIYHSKKIIDKYLKNLNLVFNQLSKNIKQNKIKEMLRGPVCHGTFERLND
jgi:glutamate-1-semialdehyde 2,1-aminomutase